MAPTVLGLGLAAPLLAVPASALAVPSALAVASSPAVASIPAPAVGAPSATTGPRMFAYYYLWWSTNHWTTSLGPNYPMSAAVKPLPATLNAAGCNPVTNYAGNSLTDVPQQIQGQDDPGFIESEVRRAAASGLAGFAVNWAGTGTVGQGVTSNPYSQRLDVLVAAVHKVNAEGIPFSLWLSYKASASILTQSAIDADLQYFLTRYGNDTAFDHQRSSRITVIWQGSRKYPASVLAPISTKYRARLRILGDETTWSAARGAYLDGNAYYWSSQDPYRNPQSFGQLGTLANAVRGSGANPDGSAKTWIAPLAPGYDKQLAGGTNCVPRNGGQTLAKLYAGNLASKPDDFGLISWNEITEGTYIAPMTRYGSQDLTVVSQLAHGGSAPAGPPRASYTYIASSRAGSAVYVNGLVTCAAGSPAATVRGSGLTTYLQRFINGGWQSVLSRKTGTAGTVTVGFIQRAVLRYRWVTVATAVTGPSTSVTTSR